MAPWQHGRLHLCCTLARISRTASAADSDACQGVRVWFHWYVLAPLTIDRAATIDVQPCRTCSTPSQPWWPVVIVTVTVTIDSVAVTFRGSHALSAHPFKQHTVPAMWCQSSLSKPQPLQPALIRTRCGLDCQKHHMVPHVFATWGSASKQCMMLHCIGIYPS